MGYTVVQNVWASKMFYFLSIKSAYTFYVYISLLIISCIIEYVTNKRTLNLDIRMISEGSCDTEDYWKFSFAIIEIKLHFKIYIFFFVVVV